MTLRSASWSALVLLCVGLSCSDSHDSPSQPPPPMEEAGSGGTGGTRPSEGGTGGTGARGGTGNQGGEGGSECAPVECALTCDIADGAPERGEACTELGNHCEDAVFDASRCECRTTDYYCCDERWGTTPCQRASGGAGSDAGGAAGSP